MAWFRKYETGGCLGGGWGDYAVWRRPRRRGVLVVVGLSHPVVEALNGVGVVKCLTMETSRRDNSLGSGLSCLLLIAKLYNVNADHDALRHEFNPSGLDLDTTSLLRAAIKLDFKAKAGDLNWRRIQTIPFPAICALKEGGWAVMTGLRPNENGQHEFLAHFPQTGDTRPISIEEAKDLLTGEIILLAPRGDSERHRKIKFGFRWFIPALKKYKTQLCEVLVVSLVINILGLAMPLFFQAVMDKVLVHQAWTTLNVLGYAIVLVLLFEFGLEVLRTYTLTHTTNRIDVQLGSQLFRHMLALPQSYFEARPVGLTTARVQELESIRAFLTSSLVTVLLDLLFVFVYLAIMLYYSTELTFLVCASLVVYGLVSAIIAPILRSRLEEKFRRGAANQSFLVEAISGIPTIKASAVEARMEEGWDERLAAYVTTSFKATMIASFGGNLIQIINKLTTVFILWMGVDLVLSRELTIGQLIAFNMLAGRVSAPVVRLAQMWQDFQQVSVSMERLGDILETPTESGDSLMTNLPPIRGDIEFRDVSFRYPGTETNVLRNVSFKIKAGQRIGIVGESGSGKSTLASLIQKSYVPQSGRVLVDSVDLVTAPPEWVRRQTGVVLQENVLFSKTVSENIAFGEPGASADRIIRAAKLAGAHEFILEMEHGYETHIEEGGTNLSGGQRQRIAIARALLREPPMLILDEATSALDYETEALIQANLAEITRDRTTLIVSHRLSVIRDCDQIFFIRKGEIIETGTHEQLLLDKDGAYAKLHRLQNPS